MIVGAREGLCPPLLTIFTTASGQRFDSTDTTPVAPTAMSGSVSESSPERMGRLQRLAISEDWSSEPEASLMAATPGTLESLGRGGEGGSVAGGYACCKLCPNSNKHNDVLCRRFLTRLLFGVSS